VTTRDATQTTRRWTLTTKRRSRRAAVMAPLPMGTCLGSWRATVLVWHVGVYCSRTRRVGPWRAAHVAKSSPADPRHRGGGPPPSLSLAAAGYPPRRYPHRHPARQQPSPTCPTCSSQRRRLHSAARLGREHCAISLAKAVRDDGKPDATSVLTKDGFVAGLTAALCAAGRWHVRRDLPVRLHQPGRDRQL
jgi:hypothetical protein